MSADHPYDPENAPPPALSRAVAEIENHVRKDGWDQEPRLYALAPTGELLEREPELAGSLGMTQDVVSDDSLTPIEQDIAGRGLDELLPSIAWPDTVQGCALAVERIVLPPGAEDEVPDDEQSAVSWAQNHPKRADVRVVVGVLRDGSRTSVMRVRGHESEDELIRDAELSPEIGNALAETLAGSSSSDQ
ncbi:PPA1309 family protein [Phytoactinopolyspora endophytica]|uniref:PPA1309 family protein n=1 Tax=Phytoactinopolyspora endophytica TaxID=1642495 RepID=UPI00101DDC0E|nr:PPA1309 family protein [Phytoactinopolyspora endophytica]